MKQSKLERAIQITILITNIINIIGFVISIVSGFIDRMTDKMVDDSNKIAMPIYHKEGDKWVDDYGNEIIPKWERSE